MPAQLKTTAAKMVAAKCTLAVHMDIFSSHPLQDNYTNAMLIPTKPDKYYEMVCNTNFLLDKLDNELQRYTSIDMVENLSAIRRQMLKHVEKWMNHIASNLLQGSKLAANLMGIAGGLTNLAKMSHT